ncbi:helix-turn-helix transcriptional regulator [Dictyobacter kobayashii]|uniref:Transcriptional regulator n=1 Tax=Dictyobacter kobayashii TaxID=2014872 RepID=A0A402AS07_9CHLR|nr:winged helix-turn-helix domain-containing protein [Dictyobacter kobayashii]GCE21885.1 transcriptional regulator [Dictyobacter kobayashii]
MAKPGWTFLTNHAQVFLCTADNNHLTAREIAEMVGITERAVQRILSDLEEDGYIQRIRVGRSNRYQIHLDRPLRHPAQHGQQVSDLLMLLLKNTAQEQKNTTPTV